MAKISVIMPVYNTGDQLKKALLSLYVQTERDFELFMMDDHSTDEVTIETEQKFVNMDARFKLLVNEENSGAAFCRNKGMEHVFNNCPDSKYIIFVDSDDLFSPDMLESFSSTLDETDADMCVCNFIMLDVVSNETSFIPARRKPGVTEKMFNIKDLGPDGLNYWMPTPWDRMIRVDLLREHNIRFQNLPDLDDLYFGHTTSICAKNIVYSKNEKPLVIYRVNNPKQMTYHVDSRSMIKAIRKLLELDVVNNDREFKEMVINMMNSNLDGMMSRCPNEEYNKECLEEAREIRNSFNS